MSFLMVTTQDGDTYRFEIRGRFARIGRSEQNDVVLQDPWVTRYEHARIDCRTDGDHIVHVAGRNPTLVNDREIAGATRLAVGDCIRVGNTRLVYRESPTDRVEFSDEPWPAAAETSGPPAEPVGGALTPVPDRLDTSPGLRLVLEADEQLVGERPLNEMFETILRLARRIAPFDSGTIMTVENGELVPQLVSTATDQPAAGITVPRTVTEHVLRTGQSVLVEDVEAGGRYERVDSIVRQRLRSFLCVPFLKEDVVIGLVYVGSRRAGTFTRRSLRLLTHLAAVAGTKIAGRRMFDELVDLRSYAEQLRAAAQIQRGLLPTHVPEVRGYQLDGSSRACYAVGGDYYDFLELGERRYAIALGDVAGKGLPAALLMSALHSGVRALAEFEPPPAEMAGRLNRLLARQLPIDRFITFFYAVLDPRDHTLGYVNAGQGRPLIIRADGATELLPSGGMPLGVHEQESYVSRTVALGPDDLLVVCSDGVTDEENEKEERFGEERLVTLVRGARQHSPASIIGSINGAIAAHHGDRPPADDLTVVVLKRLG